MVRRPEAGSQSHHLGAHPDSAPTNDVAREYLADPLTGACGGRLALRALPAAAILRRVAVYTYNADARAHIQSSTGATRDVSSPLKS